MIRTLRYRLLPTKRQHCALEVILESQRQLYNAALQERIDAYRKANVTRTYFDQAKALTEWRRSDPEASGLPANLQRSTLRRLDQAYRGFFRRVKSGGKPGFPRFRGKGRFHSFGFSEFFGITLRNGRLRFKGLPGSLRVHLHRALPVAVDIRGCTFRQDTKGWAVGFIVNVPAPGTVEGDRAVGVDLGVSTFAALSDGGFIPSLRAARASEKRLRVAQRALARKTRGSKGRERSKLAVKRCHEATSRRRAEHLRQASARLVRDYDLIVFERLNLKGLASGVLGRDVRDASWARFVSMVRDKAESAGRRVVEVDARNTSQNCSSCGSKATKSLSDRWHNCPHCGLSIDRDLNAARNILHRAGAVPGLHNVVGYDMRAGENLGLPLVVSESGTRDATQHLRHVCFGSLP